jgi:hypothetical protein
MKKRSGVRRAVAIMSRAALDSLSTKQLLARLARLRFCEESAELSDLTPLEIGLVRGILFKRTPEWRAGYADLKEALSTREHISRASVRKAVSRHMSSVSGESKKKPRGRSYNCGPR